jgi:hypothetical protein
MRLTTVAPTAAKPISRSLAIGGAVDIRKVDRTAGLCSRVAAVIERRSSVCTNAERTFSVDFARPSRNVAGAAARNQLLYKSTDADTSAFHKCGLSELIGIELHDYATPAVWRVGNQVMLVFFSLVAFPKAFF